MTQLMTTYELAAKQASGRTAELDNALVHQKDALLSLLSSCEDADEYRAFLKTVELLAPVWKATGYSYKLKEVLDRAVNQMYRSKAEAEAMVTHPENSRRPAVKRQFSNEAKCLDNVIATACLMRS
jgi:hypothetical protein